jgi:hypothetical protein
MTLAVGTLAKVGLDEVSQNTRVLVPLESNRGAKYKVGNFLEG